VLSALPWVGQELYQKKEKDLDNLLAQIGGYIQSVLFSYAYSVAVHVINYLECEIFMYC